MRLFDCTHQAAVRRATADGNLDPRLAAHAEECALCQETLQVAGSLRRLAAGDQPRLPSAGQIWWKAEIIRQLTERDEQIRKATRPILWGQAIGLVVLGAAFLLAVLWAPQLDAGSSGWLLGGPLGELMTGSAWLPVILGAVLAPLLGLVALIFFILREA
ncbi:MAG: hypothetical protein GY856_04305 [bacterium]|nr:hypothetical protein [bacterium]